MENKIELYESQELGIQLEVKLENDSVWLNRHQIAGLFGRDLKTIGKHINNVFSEGELTPHAVVANFATTASDGKTYQVEHKDFYVTI